MSRRRETKDKPDATGGDEAPERRDTPVHFFADQDALRFPKGSYVILHRPRARFRDKEAARADILAMYPDARIGQLRPSVRFWSFEVQLPTGVAAPEISTELPTARRLPGLHEGRIQDEVALCPACCYEQRVKGGVFVEHLSKYTTKVCRGSNQPSKKDRP